MNQSKDSFDVATAALEHLELLNQSDVNPLEIAAQFRTLLRRKKSPPTSYVDYHRLPESNSRRRQRRVSQNLSELRSKSLGRIQYFLDEIETTTKDLQPKISWKQVREQKQIVSLVDSQHETKENASLSRSRSSSNSIRTPSLSPVSSPSADQPTYTLSRWNSTSINPSYDEEILFPIADCNLMIKHKKISS